MGHSMYTVYLWLNFFFVAKNKVVITNEIITIIPKCNCVTMTVTQKKCNVTFITEKKTCNGNDFISNVLFANSVNNTPKNGKCVIYNTIIIIVTFL